MIEITEEKKNIFLKVIHKIQNSQFRYIKKYKGNKRVNKLAVYYHKFIEKDLRRHSNNQEVMGIIKTLNDNGYDVYLLDKNCSFIPKRLSNKKIDLFIGIDGCGGGKYYFSHLEQLNATRNFLLQTVQPPSLLRKRLERRRIHREKNLGIYEEYIRKIPYEEEVIFNKNIHKVDTLIFPNSTDEELNNELNNYGINIKRVDWTTYKEVSAIERKPLKEIEFICMCGTDPFRKGIDYAIDFFSGLPYKLHILAQLHDEKKITELINRYENNSNIKYWGFLDTAGPDFRKLAKKAMFCINFSVTEGQPTAMLHLMKTGLIPIIDKDSGSFNYKYGLILDIMNQSSELTKKRIVEYVENFSWEEYQKQSKYISEFIIKNHNYETFKKQFNDCL